jgi:hypothetical protein
MENILGNIVIMLALGVFLIPLIATVIAHKIHKEDERKLKKL